MSESGADGTQPWLSSGPAPDQRPSGGADAPQSAQPDPGAEDDPTVVTPARRRQPPPLDPAAEDDPTVVTPARRSSQPQPHPSHGARTPSPQSGTPPADPTMAAAAWQAQQQPPAVQQPAVYQHPPAPQPQLPGYHQPPAYQRGAYGQPPTPHSQQPGQQGEPAFSAAIRAKRLPPTRRLAVTGGIVVAIVLVVLVAGFVAPGFFKTKELDVAAAQAGVQQVLSDKITGYGAANVDDVTCNNGENPKVKKGATFTCAVRIDGANRQVTATFVNDDGSYEVGPPK